MISLLSIETIVFIVFGYPVSYLELTATFFGLLSVYFATKADILTWPAGMVNQWGFFFLFYQVNLYADMLLQCVFFVVTLYGWRAWYNRREDNTIISIHRKKFLSVVGVLVISSILLSLLIANFHQLLPQIFPEPAAHPLADSFVAVASVSAIILLAKKVIEAWVLWILVDIVSIGLFISQEIYLVAIEFSVFLLMSSYGYYNWSKKIHR